MRRADGSLIPRSVPVVPGTTNSLLSFTTKMPCPSWDLPHRRACPGAVYGLGSICSKCYNGRTKRHTGVAPAREARYAWVLDCLKTNAGTDFFVQTMVSAIGTYSAPSGYFRGHGSGDLFSPKYTRAWIRICEQLPHIRFWFPTKSYRLPWASLIAELNALQNVTVRPSADEFEETPPVIDGLSAGTSASKRDYTCPAHDHGNFCSTCRACWDNPEESTIYKAS